MSTLAILLLLFGAVAAERDSTPVFILDFEKVLAHVNVAPNPLKKMVSSQFANIVEIAIKLSEVVIIFVEETFCFEDISMKDRYGTPFYHLRQSLKETQVKFLPSVSKPFNTLKEKLLHLDFNIFYIDDSNAKLKIYDKQLKHFYVYFKDNVNETRANALRRHDLSMREIYFVVRRISKGPIVAFYTGKNNPIPLESQHFKPVKTFEPPRSPAVTISSSNALYKFIGVYAMKGNRRSSFSQNPMIAEESWDYNHLISRMAYSDFELEFQFEFQRERWIIESVVLLEWGEEVGRTELGVGAPWSWSYTCSDPLILINLRDGSSLTISHYQIQPFREDLRQQRHPTSSTISTSSISTSTSTPTSTSTSTPASSNDTNNTSTHCFGPAVNCGPYFNAHILAGLMVTLFFLGILTYGIMAMFNCHSNDRYDDQHGKPLVIAFEGGAN